ELERLIDDAAGEADADLDRCLEADRADQAPRARRALALAAGVRATLGVCLAAVLAALVLFLVITMLGERERALDAGVDRAVDLGDVGDAARQTDAALAEHAELGGQVALVLAAVLDRALAGDLDVGIDDEVDAGDADRPRIVALP